MIFKLRSIHQKGIYATNKNQITPFISSGSSLFSWSSILLDLHVASTRASILSHPTYMCLDRMVVVATHMVASSALLESDPIDNVTIHTNRVIRSLDAHQHVFDPERHTNVCDPPELVGSLQAQGKNQQESMMSCVYSRGSKVRSSNQCPFTSSQPSLSLFVGLTVVSDTEFIYSL